MSRSIALDTAPRPTGAFSDSASYGWVMVGVASIAMVATLPGRTHGLGMITERLLSDPSVGLSRTGFGQINLWATLLGSLFCLGVGSLVDRFGIRRCLAGVMLLLSLVVLGMTRLQAPATVFVAILLTRGLGQSALSVISISIVGKWFPKDVSIPMAVYSVLMAGGFIAAALIGRQYADLDWRQFWSALGWILLAATGLLSLLGRDPPCTANAPTRPAETPSEHAGPSGEHAGPSGEHAGPPGEHAGAIDFTHAEAIRTPLFWVAATSISLYGLIASGISLFNESILVDQGFRKEVYYESLAWGTGIGVAAKLLAGWLGIRFPIQKMLATALLLLAGSLVWLTRLASYTDVIGYVALSATAGGLLTVLFFSAWPELYGRRHLGKIQGSAQMMTVVASAFGPLLFAQSKAWSDSYLPLVWALAAAVLVMASVAWFTPAPLKTPAPQDRPLVQEPSHAG